MKLRIIAFAAALFGFASPALADSYTFNTSTDSAHQTAVNGAYGNTLTFDTTTNSGGLQMKASAWQANQNGGAITTAYLGDYTHGLGVTGIGDSSGANLLHQIDNVGGYTDFVLLQFNRAVTLTGAGLYSFAMNGASSLDNDLSWFNASAVPSSTWSTVPDLTIYQDVPSTWTQEAGAGSSSTTAYDFRTIHNTAASTKWLISAAQLPTNNLNDGFKLASITVNATPAVPEPATWAMLIFGFGMIGTMLRAARKSDERFTERMGLIAAGGDA